MPIGEQLKQVAGYRPSRACVCVRVPACMRVCEQALVKNAGRVMDLFREWDADGDGETTRRYIPLEVTYRSLGDKAH